MAGGRSLAATVPKFQRGIVPAILGPSSCPLWYLATFCSRQGRRKAGIHPLRSRSKRSATKDYGRNGRERTDMRGELTREGTGKHDCIARESCERP